MSVVSQRCWNAHLGENQRESTIHHGHWWSRASENSDWIHNGEMPMGSRILLPLSMSLQMDSSHGCEAIDGIIYDGWMHLDGIQYLEWMREGEIRWVSAWKTYVSSPSVCPKIFCSHNSNPEVDHIHFTSSVSIREGSRYRLFLYGIIQYNNDSKW